MRPCGGQGGGFREEVSRHRDGREMESEALNCGSEQPLIDRVSGQQSKSSKQKIITRSL